MRYGASQNADSPLGAAVLGAPHGPFCTGAGGGPRAPAADAPPTAAIGLTTAPEMDGPPDSFCAIVGPDERGATSGADESSPPPAPPFARSSSSAWISLRDRPETTVDTAAGRAAHTDAGADDAGVVLVETAGSAEDPPLTRVAVCAPATPRGATTVCCGAAAATGPRGSAALAAETGTLAREPAAVVASDAAAGADAGADTRAAATTTDAAAAVGCCAPVWPRPAAGACCFCGDAGATAAGIAGARPSDDPTPSSAPPPYEPSL